MIAPVLVSVALLTGACGASSNPGSTIPTSQPSTTESEQLDETTVDSEDLGNNEEVGEQAKAIDVATNADTTATDSTSSESSDETDIAETDTAETEPEPELEVEPQTDDPPPLPDGLLAAPGQRTNWTGTISGDIPFTMWLAQSGNFVRGEINYGADPIMVLGQRADLGWYFANEYGIDGQVSGSMTLPSIVGGELVDGTWGDTVMTMTYVDVDDKPYFFNPVVRSGSYRYSFAPFEGDAVGPVGQLQIGGVTKTSVRLQMSANRGAPSYNNAYIDWQEVPLNKNLARYETTVGGLDCAFDITVFDGFAFVDAVNGRFDCGFGNAASVQGIYVLEPAASRAADSPFADAVLTTTSFGPVELGQTWATLTSEFGVKAFDDGFHPFEACYYVQLPGIADGPWIMLLGDVSDESADPADAIVSRIEPVSVLDRTSAGLGLGSTEAEVRAAHGDAITEEPHVYLGEGAKYLTVKPVNGADSTVLFETNESGVVSNLRNGFNSPVTWIEGCA